MFLSLNCLEVLQQRQPLLPLKHPSISWLSLYFLLALLLHGYPPPHIIIINPYWVLWLDVELFIPYVNPVP